MDENKKITELPEASGISATDWLVMVDTVEDETKKIHPNLVGASIPVQDTAPQNPEEDDLWIDTSDSSGGANLLNAIFPVGSIVIKADNEDYSNWLGFTWERTLVGRVAVGINSSDTDFDTIGETGGNKTHTQTTDEVAPHTHQLWVESDQSGSSYGLPQSAMYWDKTKNNWANGQFGVNRTNVNTPQPMNIMNPYQVVAYWKRTA